MLAGDQVRPPLPGLPSPGGPSLHQHPFHPPRFGPVGAAPPHHGPATPRWCGQQMRECRAFAVGRDVARRGPPSQAQGCAAGLRHRPVRLAGDWDARHACHRGRLPSCSHVRGPRPEQCGRRRRRVNCPVGIVQTHQAVLNVSSPHRPVSTRCDQHLLRPFRVQRDYDPGWHPGRNPIRFPCDHYCGGRHDLRFLQTGAFHRIGTKNASGETQRRRLPACGCPDAQKGPRGGPSD